VQLQKNQWQQQDQAPPSPKESGTLRPHIEYRWPMAAPLEKTSTAYGSGAAAFGAKHSFLASSREIGQSQAKSAAFMNPSIDRFLERRPNGGVFHGRSGAAPKVHDNSVTW